MTAPDGLHTAAKALDDAITGLALAGKALEHAAGAAAVAKASVDLAVAEMSGANPYGTGKHGEFGAASAAEVAEGVELPGHLAYSHCEDSPDVAGRAQPGGGWISGPCHPPTSQPATPAREAQ